ncbi:hypothetical protein B7494_g3698 [Chlorociboria aeruginascens]|nr:hypothetical protein B7494_g3698 [Chlorociboria aeruginascens]
MATTMTAAPAPSARRVRIPSLVSFKSHPSLIGVTNGPREVRQGYLEEWSRIETLVRSCISPKPRSPPPPNCPSPLDRTSFEQSSSRGGSWMATIRDVPAWKQPNRPTNTAAGTPTRFERATHASSPPPICSREQER